MGKLVKKYISPFFGTNSGSIKPMYFWSTLFLSLDVITILNIIFCNRDDLVGLAGIESGLVIGLITVYNHGKSKSQYTEPTQQYTPEQAKKFDGEQEGPRP